MVSINLILVLLFLPPICLMAVLVEKKMRVFLVFLTLGLLAAYQSGQINSLILSYGFLSEFQISIHVAPVIEEFLKALPLILYLFISRPDKRHITECAVWTGLGFAFFENACAFSRSVSSIPDAEDIAFALSRGFGASMIHSLCSLLLIYGVYMCSKQKKLIFPGSLAMFSFVCIIHSLFNVLIQSKYTVAPFLLTIGVYAAFFIGTRAQKKKAENN